MSTHAARVAKIDSVSPITGADRIQTAYVLGTQVIVSKDAQVGDVGILFDGELVLSGPYCYENDLYRHTDLNKNKEKAGFFEDNGRVRVQKFLKVKSEGLFMPLASVSFTGVSPEKLKIGDAFTELNSIKICEQYVSEQTRRARNKRGGQKKVKSVQAPSFAKHIDTENVNYYWDKIPVGSTITLTSKSHGTSARYSYSTTYRELPRWKKWINKILPIFTGTGVEYLCGTRNVILFEEDKEKEGFHGCEGYRFEWLNKLRPYLDENMIIYGELVGYANDANIMPRHDLKILKDKAYEKKYGSDPFVYKYGCVEGQNDFLIYRIAYASPSGKVLDFTWPQVKAWCKKTGFKHVLEIQPSFVYNGDLESLKARVGYLTERPDVLTEDYIDPSHISEGIVIRVDHDTQIPEFYKSKSFAFKVCEGIAKEKEEDPEDSA